MDNAQYSKVEAILLPQMIAALNALAEDLKRSGWDVGPVEPLDRDEERGVWFVLHWDRTTGKSAAIELVLADRDLRGFRAGEDGSSPAFGWLLTTVAEDARVIQSWAPGNYSDDVGTNSVEELASRLEQIGPSSCIASDIAHLVSTHYKRPADREQG